MLLNTILLQHQNAIISYIDKLKVAFKYPKEVYLSSIDSIIMLEENGDNRLYEIAILLSLEKGRNSGMIDYIIDNNLSTAINNKFTTAITKSNEDVKVENVQLQIYPDDDQIYIIYEIYIENEKLEEKVKENKKENKKEDVVINKRYEIIINEINELINIIDISKLELRSKQDVEYNISLFKDVQSDLEKYLLDIEEKRISEIERIKSIITSLVKENSTYILSIKEERLLRVPVTYRTPTDQLEIDKIKEKIKAVEDACLNTVTGNPPIYRFSMGDDNRRFCADIDDIYKFGHYNRELGYVDVPLDIFGEKIIYPLSYEDSVKVIDKIGKMYIGADKKEGKLYHQIEKYIKTFENIKQELVTIKNKD